MSRKQSFGRAVSRVSALSTASLLLAVSVAGAIPVAFSQKAYAAAPALAACTTTSNAVSTSLAGWNTSDTKQRGSNVITANGLRVTTIANPGGNADGTSKAAAYKTTNFKLSDAGMPSIEFANYSGVRPGLQLGVDKDANGSWDGYLVYEPWAYGEGNFWSSKNFGISSGLGYTSFGTLGDYLAANPNARVTSIGYSLGSGVVGDATISKMTVGCVNYTFTLPAPDAPTELLPGNNSVTNDVNFNQSWKVTPNAVSYEYRTANLLDGNQLGPIIYSDAGAYIVNNGRVIRSNSNTPQADYYWQVRAVGAGGLKSDWSAITKVTVDTNAPSVTAFEQAYEAKENGRIRVTLTFSEAVSSITPAQGWAVVAGSNGTKYTKIYYTSKSYAVTFSDAAGNQGSYGFTVDATAPQVTAIRQDFENKQGGRVNVTLTFSEAIVPSSLPQGWYQVAGSNGTAFVKAFYSVKTHTVAFTDAIGNPGTYTFTIEDKFAPTAPTNVTVVDSNGKVVADGAVTNAGGVVVSWNGPADATSYVYKVWDDIAGDAFNGEDNAYVTTVNGTSRAGDFTQGDGTYSFRIAAVDAAGNQSEFSAPFSVAYDSTGPEITVDGLTTTSTTPTITGTVSGASTDVTVVVDGNVYTAVTTDGIWTVTVTDALSAGIYDVIALADDEAGNAGIDTTSDELIVTLPITTGNTTTGDSSTGQSGTAPVVTTNAATNRVAVASNAPANTSTNAGGTAEATGSVLGASTTAPSGSAAQVKGAATTSGDSEKKTIQNSSGNFLGLGWWWLPIIAALMVIFFTVGRRINSTEAK